MDILINMISGYVFKCPLVEKLLEFVVAAFQANNVEMSAKIIAETNTYIIFGAIIFISFALVLVGIYVCVYRVNCKKHNDDVESLKSPRHSIQDGRQNSQRLDPGSGRDMLTEHIQQESTQHDRPHTFQGSAVYTIQDGGRQLINHSQPYVVPDGAAHAIQHRQLNNFTSGYPYPYSLPQTHRGINRACDRKISEYREIQAELIQQLRSPPRCLVLICVDARPTQIGGYCINFVTGICYAYTFPTDVLPWDLHDKSRTGDPSEFEMKNLMFALLLWEGQIKSCREVQIHTDNTAINSRNNTYAFRVHAFIQHLTNCERVKTNTNEDIYVNGEENPRAFAQYILPADDLSRWRIREFQDFLTRFYRIYKFKTSHFPQQPNSPGSNTCHFPTSYYDEFVDKVDERLEHWMRNPCLKCEYMVGSSESLYPCVEE